MATRGTDDSLASLKKIGEHLKCFICLERLKKPKMLDCLHTFCLDCIQNIQLSSDQYGTKLICALCRQETYLRGNGVGNLPTQFLMAALVEELAVQEQILEGQRSEFKCQSCEKKNAAISFCKECPVFLCHSCKSIHEHLPATKSHKTCTIAQLLSGEVAYKSKLREEPKCDKHADQNINIYCNTCKQLVCTTCSVLNHKMHSLSDVFQAFEECKQEIAKLLAKAKEQLSNAKTVTVESCKKLDFMFKATNKKISLKADKEVAKIRAWEEKLKNEAKEIYEDRVKTFETAKNNEKLKEAEQTLDDVEEIMNGEIRTQILDVKPKLLQNLTEIMRKRPGSVPDKLHFIAFQETDEKSLGRLLLGDEQINHKITSVAMFSDNEIVAVDSAHKKLLSYSPSGFSYELLIDLRDPNQVAVNGLGQLVVLDGAVVKTFNRGCQLIDEFPLGLDSDSKPICLAVNNNNLIAVGYEAEGEISVHKPDGSPLMSCSIKEKTDIWGPFFK